MAEWRGCRWGGCSNQRNKVRGGGGGGVIIRHNVIRRDGVKGHFDEQE